MKDTAKMSFKRTLSEIAKFHFILDEGRKGHHLLFSPEMIRSTFERSTSDLMASFQSHIDEINDALNETFRLPTFEEKGRYIETLSPEIQSALVYGYFQLLEQPSEADEPPMVH